MPGISFASEPIVRRKTENRDEATYEFYITPRISVRAGVGWWNPGFSIGAVDSLMQVPLSFDANYNWERGKWHPFVGAGLGIHLLQFRSDQPSSDNTETKLGFNTGGGIEYFLNRTLAVKGEGRYHALGDARGEQTSGTALAVGVKTYFCPPLSHSLVIAQTDHQSILTCLTHHDEHS